MTTSKIQPPRKLTEDEDLDSFDDWWFQCVSYFGRDENFKYFFETADLQWESKSGARFTIHMFQIYCRNRVLFNMIGSH